MYDVINIGGSGHGLATAYYLAKEHGVTNVAVQEKGPIGLGDAELHQKRRRAEVGPASGQIQGQGGPRMRDGRNKMTHYKPLAERINRGEVIILDGAIGTQLQEMGLPIYHTAWAATALNTHPATVQVMHEQYIKAGADIITTNTYASARHNLEPLGLGELTGELNRRQCCWRVKHATRWRTNARWRSPARYRTSA